MGTAEKLAALIAETAIKGAINQYKEAARASQRGFQRLHRKIDHWRNRCAFLEQFIRDHQLTGDLEDHENTIRTARKIAWEKEND